VIGHRSLHAGPSTALAYIQRTASRLGLSKKQIRQKSPDIAAFAGLSDMKRPLGYHLSPSWIRLAFSAAVALDPDVLLIDDCLALTDPLFQQKCHDEVGRIKSGGATLLLVSHDFNVIRTLCERVILMERGRIIADGSASEVIETYEQSLSHRSGGLIHTPIPAFSKTYRRGGSGAAKIKDIRIEDSEGKPVSRLLTGCRYRFRLGISTQSQVEDLTARILVCDRFGNQVFGTSTSNHGLAFGALSAGQSTEVIFELDVFLAPGDYFMSAALHPGATDNHDGYDRIDNALHFEILHRGPQRTGTVWLPTRVRIMLK
jgi:lipopolysaccharide transport system ATP-binding protein